MNEPVALLRSVEVAGTVQDVRLAAGRVAEVGPHLEPSEEGLVLDGAGGWLLPGLHDHHVHLRSLAAALASTSVAPPAVHDPASFAEALRAADRRLPEGAWVRATGYHESVAGDLDAAVLQALVPELARPVRVQHRSGALWVLNRAALQAVGEPAHPNGRFFRQDAWLAERVPHQPLDLAAVGRLLADHGVTAVTDATPFADPEELEPLAEAVRGGALPQRVTVMGAPHLDPASVPAPLLVGPAKLLLPDHELPSLAEVVDLLRQARARARAVAVHCVTREALALTIAALDAAGGSRPGDRIEHGAVVPPDLREEVRRRGLTVVTQPNLVGERGDDHLELVDAADLPHLWPCRSLLDAGVAVLLGTDAPFGSPDPWALLGAATTRRTPSGRVLGADERIDAATALALLTTTGATEVQVGDAADLCLSADVRAATLADPRGAKVAAATCSARLSSRAV